MRYFKLEQDKRIPYSVVLTGLNRIGGYFESKGGDLSDLDRIIVSLINSSPVNFYPDILDRQLFIVKGSVKDVFDLFLPDLKYKRCLLLDRPLRKLTSYHIPILDVIEFEQGADEKRHLFRVPDRKESRVIASLDFVEVLLRRNPKGVRISVVEV